VAASWIFALPRSATEPTAGRSTSTGHNDPVVVDVQKDGALYASKRLSPHYPTGNTCNIAYETVAP
jgi:hypothetical protein